MAARLLHSLADDTADLQKQIGCMNGIFQIFDRHHNHLVTGRRKSLTLGNGNTNTMNYEKNSVNTDDENNGGNVKENQRVSTGSSKVSFSSSCSSSPSSSEIHRGVQQPQASAYDQQADFLESPTRVSENIFSRPYGLKQDLRDTPQHPNDLRAHRYTFDSHDTFKSRQKLKELPRLSLDSRMQNSGADLESRKLSESFSRSSSSNKKRHPSVVAKLMGLETMPGSPLSRDIHQFDLNRAIRFSPSSPRSLGKEDTSSPRRRNSDFVMKPLSSSRFPIEPAPWKQGDNKNRVSQKKADEMERRLNDLEFRPSGKDLRAFKQLLEAAQRDYERADSTTSNQVMPSRTRVLSSSSSINQVYQSPIVIMKPAKLVGKVYGEKPDGKGTSTSSKPLRKGPSLSNRRAESCTGSVDKKSDSRNVRSSSGKSPRLQQKKLEYDKRSQPPTSPSRKPSNRQLADSNSPVGKRRTKAHKSLQKNDDQLSQDICTQSKTEPAGLHQAAPEAYGSKSLSITDAAEAAVSNLMQNEDGSSANDALATLEHPSPVSVLDSSIFREIVPSPMKTQGDDEWNPAYSFSETTSSFSPEINRKKLQNVERLVQKLKQLNTSHDETNHDYISSLCENVDPNIDHRYISEILLASGLLLRDLGSTFQLHPINPELFFVLERTNGSRTSEKHNRKLVFDTVNEILIEKLEAVGNPLVKSAAKMTKKAWNARELLKELCSEIETLQMKATKRSQSEEEGDFLKSLLAEDVTIRSGNWTDHFNGEVSGLVLDVERLLFKDLVNEVVHTETSRLQAKSGRQRTLFVEE